MKVKYIFMYAFLLFNMGDIVTTLLAKYKFAHAFNETNPLYIMGMSIYTIFVIKIIMVVYLLYVLDRNYDKTNSIYLRYGVIYFVSLLLFFNMGVVFNNIIALQQSPEDVQLMPEDQRVEHYNEAVKEMGLVKNRSIGLLPSLIIMNLLQFSIWRSFENGRNRIKGIE